MFSPLSYSYVQDDEYDTRKLNNIKYSYFIYLFIQVPSLPQQMKAPPKKAVRLFFFCNIFYSLKI